VNGVGKKNKKNLLFKKRKIQRTPVVEKWILNKEKLNHLKRKKAKTQLKKSKKWLIKGLKS
jgi:hypothetical protein